MIKIAVCYGLAYGIAKPLCRALLANASVTVRDNVSMLVGMVLFTGLNYLVSDSSLSNPKKNLSKKLLPGSENQC